MNGEIGQDNEVDYQKEKAEIDYQEEKTEIDYQEESKFYGLCTNKSLYSDKTMNGTRDPLVMWIWTSIPGAKNLYDPKTMQFDYNGAMAMMLMLGVSGAIMLCIGCLQATVHLQSCRQSCLWRLQHSCFRRRLSRGARRDHLRSCACVRKQQRGAMLCVLVVLQFSAVQGMQQNGPPQQPTELSEILTALTRATQVGMSALQRLEQQASSSDDLNRRIESATKAIKAPDVWNPQASGEHPPDFTTWKHQFLNWLGFADSQYSEALSMIESLGATPIDVSTLTTVERELSTKLYHILTSYMRGAATQLSRNWSRERCGYRLYQSLLWEYQPATKQRALTLSQAIGMFPNFDGAKSMVEQIGSLENLVREYEIASGKTYDRDLLMGVLLRCSPRAIRDHLTLTMPEGTNYMSVKQAILSYEQSSKTWDYQTVLKQKTLQNTASSSNADQGPAPMEVDAVYEKGGGKGNKGNKGNKGGKGSYSWSSFGAGFRQWRKGGRKGSYKGGKKGRGKGFHKGGEKGGKKGGKHGKGGKKGGGKKLDRDVCRFCKQRGHWGNECPNRNVREVQASEASTEVPHSTVESVTQSQSASQYRIRRVRNIDFHHIANTPPDGTEHYELSEVSEEEGDWFTRRIEVQGPECYYIGDESENKQDHESDELYQWYENSLERVQGGLGPPGGLEPLSQGGSEPLNVRMVQLDTKQHVVILDSGADVSLLPRRLSDAGVEVSTPTSLRLQDAQGGAMRVEGMRRAVLQFSSFFWRYLFYQALVQILWCPVQECENF